MLEKASRQAGDGVRFERGDIGAFAPAVAVRPRLLQRRAPLGPGSPGAARAPDARRRPGRPAGLPGPGQFRPPFAPGRGRSCPPGALPFRARRTGTSSKRSGPGSLRLDPRPPRLRRADRLPPGLRTAARVPRGRGRVGGRVAPVGVPTEAPRGFVHPVPRRLPAGPLRADSRRMPLLLHLPADPGARSALVRFTEASPHTAHELRSRTQRRGSVRGPTAATRAS